MSPGVGDEPPRARLLGDETELFERYAKRLVRVTRSVVDAPHHVIEEACSIAWLQLIRTQPERGAVFAWLRVVASREALRLLGRDRREASLDEVARDEVRDLLADELEPAFGRCAELDSTIEALTTEILANSRGTNRIVKRLLADGGGRARKEALDHERQLPHGSPTDTAARMRAGGH